MSEKIQTGDVSLDKWLVFFSKPNKSNTQFIKMLQNLDVTFLTKTPTELSQFDYPDNGLLETIFKKIAFDNDSKDFDSKAKIIIGLVNNINYLPWLAKYKDTFYEVMERALIEGNYEEYGIQSEYAIKIAVEKGYIEKESFMGVAMLRGMLWGSRYPDKLAEKKLERIIKKNKFKILLGL